MNGRTASIGYAYREEDYAPRILAGVMTIWVVVIVLARTVPGSSAILLYGASLYALRGARQTIEAFTLLAILILMGRTGGAAERWVVVFAGFGRAVWDTFIGDKPIPRIVWYLTLFSGTVLVLTPIASQAPVVSTLKIISFWTGTVAMVIAFYRTRHLERYWMDWFVTLGLVLILLSVLIWISGGGYIRTANGFQGITSHPQTFGPVMSSLGALLMGLFVFHGERKWYIVLGVGFAFWGIMMSAARTALLGSALAFSIAMAAGYMSGRKVTGKVAKVMLHPAALLVYLGLAGFMFFNWTDIQTRLTDFLVKDETETVTVFESLQDSRGFLIAQSMENFRENPITGIGFGVPSDIANFRIQTGFLGLPTGASIEKGFLPSAVLEETGVVGAALLIIVIIALVRPAWKSGNVMKLWILFIALFVNFGEAILLSLGGQGFYFWMWLAFIHTSSLPKPPTNQHEQFRR